MIDREQAMVRIRESPFQEQAEALGELLQPSIRLAVGKATAEDFPLGASRLGGLPDLPKGVDWPRCGDRPMALVAQLFLPDLAPYDLEKLLPEQGWLYFFFDAANESPFEDEGDTRSWRVLYHKHNDEPEALYRADLPDPHDAHNIFGFSSLGFGTELTLPSFGSTLLENVPLSPEAREEYENLVFSLPAKPPVPSEGSILPFRRWIGQMKHRWIGDPIHRVFGHPEHFQLDPRIDWERMEHHRPVVTAPDESTKHAAQQWLLLLQVDAYQGGPNWMWGDNGTLYFGIRREDLAARNFEAAQWTVECG